MRPLKASFTLFKTLKGISLIEVIVALLLVSISGFGVLAMSNFSTQESNSLRFELSADYIARTLLSRAQANANTVNQSTYEFDNSKDTAGVGQKCETGCDAIDIAQLDVAEFREEAALKLPQAHYRAWWEMNQLKIAILWTGPIKNNPVIDCPFSAKPNDACRIYTTTITL